MTTEPKSRSTQRLVIAAAGTVLLVCAACNLWFVWHNVSLNRDVLAAQVKLQNLNRTQQLMPAIAQDLVNLSSQHPWLVPILQKYNLVRPAPAAQPAPKRTHE